MPPYPRLVALCRGDPVAQNEEAGIVVYAVFDAIIHLLQSVQLTGQTTGNHRYTMLGAGRQVALPAVSGRQPTTISQVALALGQRMRVRTDPPDVRGSKARRHEQGMSYPKNDLSPDAEVMGQ